MNEEKIYTLNQTNFNKISKALHIEDEDEFIKEYFTSQFSATVKVTELREKFMQEFNDMTGSGKLNDFFDFFLPYLSSSEVSKTGAIDYNFCQCQTYREVNQINGKWICTKCNMQTH